MENALVNDTGIDIDPLPITDSVGGGGEGQMGNYSVWLKFMTYGPRAGVLCVMAEGQMFSLLERQGSVLEPSGSSVPMSMEWSD